MKNIPFDELTPNQYHCLLGSLEVMKNRSDRNRTLIRFNRFQLLKLRDKIDYLLKYPYGQKSVSRNVLDKLEDSKQKKVQK